MIVSKKIKKILSMKLHGPQNSGVGSVKLL